MLFLMYLEATFTPYWLINLITSLPPSKAWTWALAVDNLIASSSLPGPLLLLLFRDTMSIAMP